MKVSLGGDVDGIAITSITPKVAGAKAVTFEKDDWTVQYAKAEAGKKANELTTYATTFPNEAGTWYMKSTCTKTGDANGAVIYTKVTVDAAALTGTTVKFQGDEDGEYVDSLTFNDTNLTEKLEFTAPDGTKLVPGASDKDAPEGANCDIVYKKVGGSAALDEIVTAGDYVAEITGTGDYDGQRASVRFTVDALDLGKASIVVPDTTAGTFEQTIAGMTINGKPAGVLAGLLKVETDTSDKASYTDNGKYTVTVSASSAATAKDIAGAKAADSIKGTATVDFYKVGDTALFKYGQVALNGDGVTETESIDVDLSAKKPAYFDIEKVTAKLAAGNTDVDSDDISVVSVTNKETGAAATEADLKTPSTWVVTLGVDRGSDFAQGGTAQLIVKVTNGTVKSANVFVSVNGKNIPGGSNAAATELEYTGENLRDTIDIAVSYKGKDLVEGTDYTVEVTKDGKKVDEIVNAGEGYQIELKSDTYKLNGAADTHFQATIYKFNVTSIAISGAYDKDHAAKGQIRVKDLDLRGFAPYTGEEITPAIGYIAKIDKEGKPVWKDLPPSSTSSPLRTPRTRLPTSSTPTPTPSR